MTLLVALAALVLAAAVAERHLRRTAKPRHRRPPS